MVEIYLSHVLIAADQWADIPQFLDVCGGLNEDQREAYVKQVSVSLHSESRNFSHSFIFIKLIHLK